MTINNLGHQEAKDRQALTSACVVFADVLKRFIKTPKAGDTAQVDATHVSATHVAAHCLFEVRRLENALNKAPLAPAQRRQENKEKTRQPQEHV